MQWAERYAAAGGGARRVSICFVGLFLSADLKTRRRRVGRGQRDASNATPEIAGLREHYNIGALDWADIDASGTPEQTVERYQTRIAHGEAA